MEPGPDSWRSHPQPVITRAYGGLCMRLQLLPLPLHSGPSPSPCCWLAYWQLANEGSARVAPPQGAAWGTNTPSPPCLVASAATAAHRSRPILLLAQRPTCSAVVSLAAWSHALSSLNKASQSPAHSASPAVVRMQVLTSNAEPPAETEDRRPKARRSPPPDSG
jgi:hypothetical protein